MPDSNVIKEQGQVQDLICEVKSIIGKGGDLNLEKENLAALIEQADFLLGKYDEIYDQFIEVFTSMGNFDFSKRLAYVEPGDNFINFIVNGINMVNEELGSSAVHQGVLKSLLNNLTLADSIVLLTDTNGFIRFINSVNCNLPEFSDKLLIGQSINCLFSNFSVLEERIKKEGSARNINSSLKWLGKLYPVTVDVALSMSLGKIEGLIYVVCFPEKVVSDQK